MSNAWQARSPTHPVQVARAVGCPALDSKPHKPPQTQSETGAVKFSQTMPMHIRHATSVRSLCLTHTGKPTGMTKSQLAASPLLSREPKREWKCYGIPAFSGLHQLISDSAIPHYVSDPLPRPLWDHRSTGQL